MKRIPIDNYRGWEISFDLEKERFFVQSDNWDQQEDRGSFTACKKWIDEFIRTNTDFKPVKIHQIKWGELGVIITVVGIRKDGRFAIEDEKGERGQLSDYNLSDYILYDERNVPIQKQVADIQAKINVLNTEKGKAIDRLHKVTMVDHKRNLGLDKPKP